MVANVALLLPGSAVDRPATPATDSARLTRASSGSI